MSCRFFDFPNEAELWEEVQEITLALQKADANVASRFYRELFSHMLTGKLVYLRRLVCGLCF
jgi:hypothetical protein